MAGEVVAEPIPDDASLFCRVHRAQYNAATQKPSREIFKKPDQSVDWEKYCTQADTAARHPRPHEIVGVATIKAKACRGLGQEVIHVPLGDADPGRPNRAHSEIRGQKSKLIMTQLRDAVTGVWPNPAYQELL
jgi:hypothetical protein